MHIKSLERFWSKLVKKAEIHTIRTKLIISFLIMALLPFSIMTLFSYNTYFRGLMYRVSEYSQEVVSRMARELDEYFLDRSPAHQGTGLLLGSAD